MSCSIINILIQNTHANDLYPKSFLFLYRKELVDELKRFHLCQDLKLIIGIGVWQLWNFRFPILSLYGLTGSLTKLFDFLKLVWIIEP